MNIVEIRNSKVLDKKFNYPQWGVMSRRDFIKKCKMNGCTVQIDKVRQWDKERKEEEEIERRWVRHGFASLDDTSVPSLAERRELLKAGFYKDVHRVYFTDGRCIDITKIEYDYFNSL